MASKSLGAFIFSKNFFASNPSKIGVSLIGLAMTSKFIEYLKEKTNSDVFFTV